MTKIAVLVCLLLPTTSAAYAKVSDQKSLIREQLSSLISSTGDVTEKSGATHEDALGKVDVEASDCSCSSAVQMTECASKSGKPNCCTQVQTGGNRVFTCMATCAGTWLP